MMKNDVYDMPSRRKGRFAESVEQVQAGREGMACLSVDWKERYKMVKCN